MGTTNNIDALKYADKSLRSDKDIVLSAIQNSGVNSKFNSDSKWTDV